MSSREGPTRLTTASNCEIDELSLTGAAAMVQPEQGGHRAGESAGQIRIRVAEACGPALLIGHIQGVAGKAPARWDRN